MWSLFWVLNLVPFKHKIWNVCKLSSISIFWKWSDRDHVFNGWIIVCLFKKLQIWYTKLPLSYFLKMLHFIWNGFVNFKLSLHQLKVQVNTSFLFFLHEIMLCKLVHDDVFHWDQMLKNQKLNLDIDKLYVLQLVVLGIEYVWLNDSNLFWLVSLLKIGCINVHVSWMWVVYKCQFHILVIDSVLGLFKPIHMRDSLFCSLVTYWKTPSTPLNNTSWVA